MAEFKITDLQSSSWAFRKLKVLLDKEKEITDLAEVEKKRILDWEKEEKEKLQRDKDYFNFLLEDYYREQKLIDPKFKLTTPYGKVSSRKQQPKWTYDDSKTLEWLRANNEDLIRVKEEIDKAELKKIYKIVGNNVVTEDGEIVDGVNIEEREDSINIKVVE